MKISELMDILNKVLLKHGDAEICLSIFDDGRDSCLRDAIDLYYLCVEKRLVLEGATSDKSMCMYCMYYDNHCIFNGGCGLRDEVVIGSASRRASMKKDNKNKEWII